jgi:hypothetical protein
MQWINEAHLVGVLSMQWINEAHLVGVLSMQWINEAHLVGVLSMQPAVKQAEEWEPPIKLMPSSSDRPAVAVPTHMALQPVSYDACSRGRPLDLHHPKPVNWATTLADNCNCCKRITGLTFGTPAMLANVLMARGTSARLVAVYSSLLVNDATYQLPSTMSVQAYMHVLRV